MSLVSSSSLPTQNPVVAAAAVQKMAAAMAAVKFYDAVAAVAAVATG